LLYAHSTTRSSIKHLKEIRELKRKKTDAELELDSIDADLKGMNNLPQDDENLEKLLVLISECKDVVAKLDLPNIPIDSLDDAARTRYKKKIGDISEYDVLDTVRSYSPTVADAWHQV